MDTGKLLPLELQIAGIDNVWYECGLSLVSYRSETKRKIYYTPTIIATELVVNTIRCIVVLLIDDHYWLVRLGEYNHMFGLKLYMNLFRIICSLFALLSQLINYYVYKQGVDITFIKLFRMMSGSVTPNSLGLTDQDEIVKFVKISKIIFKMIKINNGTPISIVITIFTIGPYLLFSDAFETIVYGIPHSVMNVITVHYFMNFFCYQILYFYLISKYVKSKLKNIMKHLSEVIKQNNRMERIEGILRSLDNIYREITDYNTTYWSLFFLMIWIVFAILVVIIDFLFYTILFNSLPISLLIAIGYGTSVLTIPFIFTILIAASVNSTSDRLYRLLNRLMSSTKIRVEIVYRFKVVKRHVSRKFYFIL